jgi:hypothetical protein
MNEFFIKNLTFTIYEVAYRHKPLINLIYESKNLTYTHKLTMDTQKDYLAHTQKNIQELLAKVASLEKAEEAKKNWAITALKETGEWTPTEEEASDQGICPFDCITGRLIHQMKEIEKLKEDLTASEERWLDDDLHIQYVYDNTAEYDDWITESDIFIETSALQTSAEQEVARLKGELELSRSFNERFRSGHEMCEVYKGQCLGLKEENDKISEELGFNVGDNFHGALKTIKWLKGWEEFGMLIRDKNLDYDLCKMCDEDTANEFLKTGVPEREEFKVFNPEGWEDFFDH